MPAKIKLTREQINHIVELYKSGLSHKEVSQRTGFDVNKIRRTLKAEGVVSRTNSFYIRILNSEQELDVVQKYKSGKNMNQLADEYGCSRSVIDDTLRRHNVQKRSPSEAYRTYQINDYYFDEIDNQDKAYILGFLYTDGHNTSKYDIGHYDIGLTLQLGDKYILDEMCHKMGMNRESRIIINSTNKRPYARIDIMNKHMVLQLDSLGVVPNKTRKTEFPYWLRKDLYPHFIRGILDGDGCITKKLDLVTFAGSRKLMEDLSDVVYEQLGFRQYVGNYKQSPGISYVHFSGLEKRIALLDWIYKDADMKLTRKYDLYLQMKEKYAA